MKTVRDLISDLLKEDPNSVVFLSHAGGVKKQMTPLRRMSTALCENGEIVEHTDTKWSPHEPQDPNAALILH